MRIGILRIGALARRAGTTVPTIRYYEEIGLLRPAARSGGQRTYDNEDVRRLSFIRRCRDFDFSIDDIRTLLSLLQNGKSCTEARELAPKRANLQRVAWSNCAAAVSSCRRWKQPSPRWSRPVPTHATAGPYRTA